jgi:hypothetical protein
MKRLRSGSPKLLTASTDKTLPKVFEGKLEPNYYCRGWNEKRAKYCGSRAGFRTDHPGLGRCRVHGGLKAGGDARVTNGSYSVVKGTSLGELIEHERNRMDPLDLSGELATLRALVADLRARNPEAPDHASEIVLANSIGVMVERMAKMQSSVSRSEVNRLVQELWRSVDGRVADEKLKREMVQDWHRIGLGL